MQRDGAASFRAFVGLIRAAELAARYPVVVVDKTGPTDRPESAYLWG